MMNTHSCIRAAVLLLGPLCWVQIQAAQPPTGTAATSPGPAKSGKAAATAAEATKVLDSFNPQSVSNGPTAAAVFTLSMAAVIMQVQTYHWNEGKGAKPGTVALRDEAGKFYGPWKAKGNVWKGGVADSIWIVTPNVTVPAGTYTVVDSDVATWSTNAIAANRGFVKVLARPAK